MNTLHLLTAPAAHRTRPRRRRLLAFAVVAAIDAIAFYASATRWLTPGCTGER